MDLDSDDENVNEADFYTFLNIAKEVSRLNYLCVGNVSPKYSKTIVGYKRRN